MDILVVDHSLIDAYLTKEALQAGFAEVQVHMLHDGELALAFLQRQGVYGNAPKPDLIVLDLYLPKMSGLEVLCTLKTALQFRHIPVVVLTAPGRNTDQLTAYVSGAHAYFCKPLEHEAYLLMGYAIAELWNRGLLRHGIRPPLKVI